MICFSEFFIFFGVCGLVRKCMKSTSNEETYVMYVAGYECEMLAVYAKYVS